MFIAAQLLTLEQQLIALFLELLTLEQQLVQRGRVDVVNGCSQGGHCSSLHCSKVKGCPTT